MARCRCGSLDACGCLLAGGDGVTVSGSGNPGAPWVIDVDPRSTDTIDVDDTVGLDMEMTGKGIKGDPYVIFGTVKLADLLKVLDTPNVDLTLTDDGTGVLTLTATLNAQGLVIAQDTPDINFTVTGGGTLLDPTVITADIPCLACDAPGNVGDVLTRQPDGTYLPGPPTTAPVGAITVGNGLVGDGSSGNPLRLNACTYDDVLTWCPTP